MNGGHMGKLSKEERAELERKLKEDDDAPEDDDDGTILVVRGSAARSLLGALGATKPEKDEPAKEDAPEQDPPAKTRRVRYFG